jgi:hypothetical protein
MHLSVRNAGVKFSYDKSTDLGEDGAPVGYDVRHASTKRDFIMSVILAGQPQAAAE